LDTAWFVKHYVLPHTPAEEEEMIAERLSCFEAMKAAAPENLIVPKSQGVKDPGLRGVPLDLSDLSPTARYQSFLPRKLVSEDRRDFQVPSTTELFRFRTPAQPKTSSSSSSSSSSTTYT